MTIDGAISKNMKKPSGMYRNIKSKKYKSSGWIKLNHQPALQFCPDNSINKPVFRELVMPWFRELVMSWFHFKPWNPAASNLYIYVPRWEKIPLLDMVILPLLANPYNGCVNPYYCLGWVFIPLYNTPMGVDPHHIIYPPKNYPQMPRTFAQETRP